MTFTNDDILRLLVSKRMPYLLRRDDVNNDIVIGLVGERGAGKSVGGGAIALHDYLLVDEPVWGNMLLNYEVIVNDDLAGYYGLNGGAVQYQSRPLNMRKILHGDSEYHGGCVIVDEINIALADARRAMATQNLAADDIIQQLRKMETCLIYTCIDEGFVDLRIRDNTDIFIECKDYKFNRENWFSGHLQGATSEWHVFARTDKGAYILQQERGYDDYVGRWFFRAKEYWGVIDTRLKQQRKRYTVDIMKDDGEQVAVGNIAITQNQDKRAWIDEKVAEIVASGRKELTSAELWAILGTSLTREQRSYLASRGIVYDRPSNNYIVHDVRALAGIAK